MKMIQRSFNSSLSLPLSKFLRCSKVWGGWEKEPEFGLVCSSVCPRQLKPHCLVPLWQRELIYMKGCSENGCGSTKEKAHRWVSSSVCKARAQHSSVKFTTLLQKPRPVCVIYFAGQQTGKGKKNKDKSTWHIELVMVLLGLSVCRRTCPAADSLLASSWQSSFCDRRQVRSQTKQTNHRSEWFENTIMNFQDGTMVVLLNVWETGVFVQQ